MNKNLSLAQIKTMHKQAEKSPPRLEGLVKSAADLQTKIFPPLNWIAPNVLPEGLSMLAGKPKIGKSWMGLDLAIAVAAGGKFLGEECQQGDVLALFLEDNDRRLQRRMTMMLGAQTEVWPERLTYATNWPRLADGGNDLIREWIGKAKKPRLIVVDILEKVRQRVTSKQTTQYSADYEALESLHKIATEFQLSVLVLHHQRKAVADDLMDTVSGTLGIGGALDTLLVLGTDEMGHFLYGRGRDLEEFSMIIRQNERCRWDSLGSKPEGQASPERQKIVTVLRQSDKPMGVDAIAAAVGAKKANIKALLSKMHQEGAVERVATGIYKLPNPQPELDIGGGIM
jgi:hypothetical protein